MSWPLVAAVGIYRGLRWGWLLGVATAGIGVGLYVVQETVGLPGLPGLPRQWWEPSRIATPHNESESMRPPS